MRDLYGDDIGTTITFRDFGDLKGAIHEAHHPWPAETIVSAGQGVVFARKGGSYTTLFMEVYPPGAAFIRGEGKTPRECEDAAWTQYQAALHCPASGDGQHDWHAKGYKNGAGFCRNCNTFKSKCFTGEQLGQHCHVCGVGTTWHWETDADGNTTFECEEHHVQDTSAAAFRALRALFREGD